MELYHRPTLIDKERYPIRFWYVYLISLISTFHSLLVAYNSSTYMEQFVSASTVGLLYSAGAAGSIVCFFMLPGILRKYGNFIASISIMAIAMAALCLLGIAPGVGITVAAFILFLAVNPLTYLNIDVFSEALLGENDAGTGSKRGLALSLMSAAALAAPLTMSLVVGDSNNLSQLYFIAMFVGLIYIAAVIGAFRHFYDSPYQPLRVRQALSQVWRESNLRNVVSAHFLLQIFFTWAIVYIPLFLATEAKLGWDSIGIIISAGLAAFVLFEYPIGLLADKYWGEVEMMAVGFVILALTAASIAYMPGTSIFAWMLLMFFSRFGASLVEVTTESYFFKQVRGEDASLMTIFRLTRPTANLAGALLGTITLLFLPFNLAFIVLGFTMACGVFLTTRLTDTR